MITVIAAITAAIILGFVRQAITEEQSLPYRACYEWQPISPWICIGFGLIILSLVAAIWILGTEKKVS
jgi:hypothetical protein